MSIKYTNTLIHIDIEFWTILSDKILYDKLLTDNDSQTVNIQATYQTQHNSYTQQQQQQLSSILHITNTSFNQTNGTNQYLTGQLILCNTLDQFTRYNTVELIQQYKSKLWQSLLNKDIYNNIELLSQFILLTYNDIKHHKHYNIGCIPQLILPSNILSYNITNTQSISSNLISYNNDIQSIIHDQHTPYFVLLKSTNNNQQYTVHSLQQLQPINVHDYNSIVFGVIDTINDNTTTNTYTHLLRNLITFISITLQLTTCDILLYNTDDITKSTIITVSMHCNTDIQSIELNDIKVAGWEKNLQTNKISPKTVNLNQYMNNIELYSSSVNLNLQLMKWRLMPNIDLELIKNTKCLLLGSGTLGCNISRCLLSYGCMNITLVDSSTVSYSNPVRQTLFTYNDTIDNKQYKSIAAANALKLIHPLCNANGIVLTIPMAGHKINDNNELNDTIQSYNKLVELIEQHDIIFLLTDSRESRYLPTLLCQSMNKLCINTALGFDQFVVIRHGCYDSDQLQHNNNNINNRLGCYFCNDVIAPMNTLHDRTLDQQCTVTRPGLSYISSGIAVELAIATLHHHDKQYANVVEYDNDDKLLKGFNTLPHTVRGFLNNYTLNSVVGSAFDYCVACSKNILDTYNNNNIDFIINVLNQPPDYLETISGLKQYKLDTEDKLQQMSVDLSNNDSNNGDDDDW